MGELCDAARTADALLQCCGGRTVLLRMPAPASAGDTTEQLGLAVPVFQDVELGPAVFRKARSSGGAGRPASLELMISATAVAAALGTTASSSASVLFATAFGVAVDGVLMEIVSATQSEVGGLNYVYRLVVRAPLVAVV